MRTKTNRCKTLIRRASVLILTLLMGGGPAGAQEDINKLPTDVQDALATIANYLGKGGVAIADFTSLDSSGTVSHDMWKDNNLVKEVPAGDQQVRASENTVLGTSVDMTVTISASPDCELRIRNGRYYWYPQPPCPD